MSTTRGIDTCTRAHRHRWHAVIGLPCSALVIEPTCRSSVNVMTRCGFVTVETSVSSRFKMFAIARDPWSSAVE